MSESASVKSSIAALPGRVGAALDFRYGAFVWVGILGTAITFLAGLEGLLALNERVRTTIATWRSFTHSIWATLFGWIGIKIPPSLFALLNFTLFALVLALGVRIRAKHFANNLTPEQRSGTDVKAWRMLVGFVAVIVLSLLSLVVVVFLAQRGITIGVNVVLVIWGVWSLIVMIACFLWTHRFDKRALQIFPLALIYSSAVFLVPFIKSATPSYLDSALFVSSLAAINLIFSVMMRIAPPVALRKRLSAAIGLALLVALPVLVPMGVAEYHITSGTSHMGKGQRAEALAEFRKSIAIYEYLARSDSGSADRQSLLALSYSSFGDTLLTDGQRAEATGYYRKAADIGEKTVATDPANPLHQRNLSIYLRQLGDMKVADGAHDDAIDLYRRCVQIAKRIIESNPANADAQIDLGFYNSKLGDVLAASGDYAGAVEPYKEAVKSGETLWSTDQTGAHARNLGIYYRQLGDALEWSGAGDDAVFNFREAVKIGEDMLQQGAADEMLHDDLDVYINRLANLLYKRGEYAEAALLYQKSFELREALAAAEPKTAKRATRAVEALGNLAATVAVNGDRDLALSHFKAALARSERIAEQTAGSAPATAASRARAEALNTVGWYALESADFEKALAVSESALSLQPDYALPMMNKAYALLYLGRPDDAAAIYLAEAEKPLPDVGNRVWRDVFWDGFAILRRVGRENPSFDEWQRTLQAKK